MKLTKIRHGLLSTATGILLLVALFLIVKRVPQVALADPGDLFVTPDGTGVCSQVSPCDLPTALDGAIGGETIYLSTGTYRGEGGAVVTLTKSVVLRGGWDGAATGTPVVNPQLYPSTLDGENERRVVFLSEDTSATLDGLIISDGNATNVPESPGRGGGIFGSGSAPIITNNIIRNNTAKDTASAQGGGIYLTLTPAPTVISGNTFISNTASPVGQGKGGGVYVSLSTAAIRSNTFQGNDTGNYGQGGGIHLFRTSAEVSDNVIKGNHAVLGYGGGFYAQIGNVTLTRNAIIGNASDNGGVTFESTGQVTMTNNVVGLNDGGGVVVRGNATYPFAGRLLHNTIAQNGRQGIFVGLRSGYSSMTLTNNIIVSHTTGIYVVEEPTNYVTATHTLFYGHDTKTSGAPMVSTNEITGSAPRFVDVAGLDYRIQDNSPAVDAGIPVPWLVTDIDGEPRPRGDGYDIGAHEFGLRSIYLALVVVGA